MHPGVVGGGGGVRVETQWQKNVYVQVYQPSVWVGENYLVGEEEKVVYLH